MNIDIILDITFYVTVIVSLGYLGHDLLKKKIKSKSWLLFDAIIIGIGAALLLSIVLGKIKEYKNVNNIINNDTLHTKERDSVRIKINKILFEVLNKEIKNYDTSINKKEVNLSPIDTFSAKKIDTLNQIKEKISNIKNYLSAQNAFSNSPPDVKDSIKRTLKNIDEKQKMLSLTVSNGYVYIGTKIGDEWKQDNFDNLTNPNKFPILGDRLYCKSPVFIRAGASHNTGHGWENQKLLGTLNKTKTIVVKEIIALPNDYYWIKF